MYSKEYSVLIARYVDWLTQAEVIIIRRIPLDCSVRGFMAIGCGDVGGLLLPHLFGEGPEYVWAPYFLTG